MIVTVYRPDGVAEQKESVDARECVKGCGYTYAPKVVEAPKEAESPKRGRNSKQATEPAAEPTVATLSTVTSELEI